LFSRPNANWKTLKIGFPSIQIFNIFPMGGGGALA